MSLTRSALISQFLRDCQALRDALIGLNNAQLSDPTFSANGTLHDRLSIISAHYYRAGEILAHYLHLQADPPLEEDDTWRQVAIAERVEWSLADMLADLEDAWAFYDDMLHTLSDEGVEWYVRTVNGSMARVAFDASREVSAWRLRSS